jgi:hypothetical protein
VREAAWPQAQRQDCGPSADSRGRIDIQPLVVFTSALEPATLQFPRPGEEATASVRRKE